MTALFDPDQTFWRGVYLIIANSWPCYYYIFSHFASTANWTNAKVIILYRWATINLLDHLVGAIPNSDLLLTEMCYCLRPKGRQHDLINDHINLTIWMIDLIKVTGDWYKDFSFNKPTYFWPFIWTFNIFPKLYIPSTLNIDFNLWHTQLIVWAENVKSCVKSWVFPFTFQAYILPHTLNCKCFSLLIFHIWILEQFKSCPKWPALPRHIKVWVSFELFGALYISGNSTNLTNIPVVVKV